MTRIDDSFAALSHRMRAMGAPGRAATVHEPIASLIDKVNAAKLRYQPGAR